MDFGSALCPVLGPYPAEHSDDSIAQVGYAATGRPFRYTGPAVEPGAEEYMRRIAWEGLGHDNVTVWIDDRVHPSYIEGGSFGAALLMSMMSRSKEPILITGGVDVKGSGGPVPIERVREKLDLMRSMGSPGRKLWVPKGNWDQLAGDTDRELYARPYGSWQHVLLGESL